MATTGGDPVFVDTNVLVYAELIGSPFRQQALVRLEEYERRGTPLWISRQILREYLSTMTRSSLVAGQVSTSSLRNDIEDFVQTFHLAEDNAAITTKLLDLMSAIPVAGKQVHDANIVATMLVHGIPRLLTHNTADFKRFSGYITVEPLVP